MAEEPKDSEQAKLWRQAGLAFSLPMMMLAGPLVGYFLAYGIVRWFGWTGPWAGRLKLVGLAFGIVAGIRETYKVIRKISSDS